MFVQFALGAWPLSMRLFMHSNAELFIHMNYYCCLLFYYIKLIIKFIMLNEMYYIEWCAQAHGIFTKARARAYLFVVYLFFLLFDCVRAE